MSAVETATAKVDIVIVSDVAGHRLDMLAEGIAVMIRECYSADDQDDDGNPTREDGYGQSEGEAFTGQLRINGKLYGPDGVAQ